MYTVGESHKCNYFHRQQQECQERELDERIATSGQEKELKKQQLEQEEKLAQVSIL